MAMMAGDGGRVGGSGEQGDGDNYGYEKPSAIQQRAVVPIIMSRDVIAQAQSGTGKTSMIVITVCQIVDTQSRERQFNYGLCGWKLQLRRLTKKSMWKSSNKTLGLPFERIRFLYRELRIGGSKLDVDIMLKLIPQWSDNVEDWNLLVEPLIDNLFAEPSNAMMVKFLSYISEQLADTADVVFHRILLRTRQLDEWKSHDSEIDNPVKLAHSLFDRLCPLLVIRLLPLRVFNNLDSSLMYGVLRDQDPYLLFLVRNACGICLSPIVDLTFLVHFSSAGFNIHVFSSREYFLIRITA